MVELFSGGLLPIIYVFGFAGALGLSRHQWIVARLTALLGLLTTLAAAVGAVLSWSPLDKLGLTLALLVSLLGWVIIDYAARYLQGEPDQPLFVRAMLYSLACVSVLVVSRNLLVIVLAWSGTSMGLHFLLTYYRARKAAQIVAHKKFIISRMADLCLLAALVLIWNSCGTLTLDGISAYVGVTASLPSPMCWAACLFALAAILKSAQLPLHGWLIQVMEAPTPVSALLHAGIVNIGGFVLIRLAVLIAAVPAAQAMLVLTGSLTAVLAGLVMMTRISIKVRLAWSTCAQMGFMLMEVGLGLYALALLHLVAHSLYKAHAFLTAGETVAEAKRDDLLISRGTARSPLWYLGTGALSVAVVAGAVFLWRQAVPGMRLPAEAATIMALGLAPLLWLEQDASAMRLGLGMIRIAALTQLYLAWHLLFAHLAPAAMAPSGFLQAWAIVSFSLLYTAQIWLRHAPRGRLAQRLFPWAYCGFYLDEIFTRLTFKFWPARLAPERATVRDNPNHPHIGDMV